MLVEMFFRYVNAATSSSVSVIAAATMSTPPIHAEGPRRSPSNSTPRNDPSIGSILRNTAAREAGTWWMPQFQSSVEPAVQKSPLAAEASHAASGTRWTGGGPSCLSLLGEENAHPADQRAGHGSGAE